MMREGVRGVKGGREGGRKGGREGGRKEGRKEGRDVATAKASLVETGSRIEGMNQKEEPPKSPPPALVFEACSGPHRKDLGRTWKRKSVAVSGPRKEADDAEAKDEGGAAPGTGGVSGRATTRKLGCTHPTSPAAA